MRIGFGPRDILHVVFRHKLKIAVVFVLSVVISTLINISATRQYEINATLLVKTNRSIAVSTGGDGNIGSAAVLAGLINSYTALLSDGELATRVLREVGVAKVYPDLTTNASAAGAMAQAVLKLQNDLFISNQRETVLISVKYLHSDPAVGAEVVNRLINDFLDEQGAVLANPQSKFIEAQAADAQDKLEAAQGALASFRLAHQITQAQDQIAKMDSARFDQQMQYNQMGVQLAQFEQQNAALANALKSGVPATIELSSDNDLRYRSVDDANTRLTDLKLQESQLLKNYQEGSEPVQRIRAQITLMQGTIDRMDKARTSHTGVNPVHQDIQTDAVRLDGQIAGLKAARQTIATQIDGMTKALDRMKNEASTYANLQRQYEIADQAYRTYMQSLEQAHLAENLNREKITDVSVVSHATPSYRPVRPRKLINTLLGILLGLIFGTLLAIIAEVLDEAVSTPEQAEEALGLPVLMVMAEVRADRPARE